MRPFSVLSAALLLAATSWALTITDPGQNTTWDASIRSQNCKWTSVSTDATNFTVVLVNMQKNPPTSITLKENVLTSAGSTTLDGPSSGWPTGAGYQLNLVQNATGQVGILAQSEQFNINGTTTPFTSSISSSSTSSGTSPSSSGTGSSGGGKNGAVGLTVQTGFIAGLAVAGAFLA